MAAEDTTDPMKRVGEIRAELNRLAPYEPAGEAVTAGSLGRYLAMEAQVAWARMTSMDWPILPADIGLLQGNFAAAHALLALHELAPQEAGEVAEQIHQAFEDGGGVGEWLRDHHGADTERIAGLAAELAKVTPQTCGSCLWGVVDVKAARGCTCDPGPEGQHQRYCGTEPCPNGCWDKVHPAGSSGG